MKKPLFINPEYQRTFEKNGIVKMMLFDECEITELHSLFLKIHTDIQLADRKNYFFSIYNNELSYKTKLFELFMPLLQPKLKTVFANYKVLTVIAQIKGKGVNSVVNIHQDLSVVDESIHHSCTFWIPLMKTTLENGAIFSLPGSQNYYRGMRTHTMHYQFSEVEDIIKKNAVCYPTEKGEALGFDSGNIHFSPPNFSGEVRLSIAVSVVPEEAPVEIGFYEPQKNTKKIEIYKAPDNFWYLYTNFEKERLERPAFGVLSRIADKTFPDSYNRESFLKNYPG